MSVLLHGSDNRMTGSPMTITVETAYVLKLPPDTAEVLRILHWYDTQPQDRATLEQALRVAYLRGYRHGLEDQRRVYDRRFGQEPRGK